MQHQCFMPCGNGPEGLFCKTHAPLVETEGTEWFEVWNDRITPVVVTKSTGDYVWFNGRKRKKHDQWTHYFETREAAKDWLVNQAKQKIESLKFQIKSAEEHLKKAELL